MNTISIKKVQDNSDRKLFVAFPRHLYRDNSYWIPSILSDDIRWLDEVVFWKDETAFLCTLITEYRKKTTTEKIKPEIENLEKILFEMTGGELDNLQRMVQNHEHFLNELLRNNSSDDEDYRQKHRKIKFDFDSFEKK